LNAIIAASRLSFVDAGGRTPIGKSGVQGVEIDARPACVPVDHGGVLQVLAKDEVRGK
jgi:hypothetical protein